MKHLTAILHIHYYTIYNNQWLSISMQRVNTFNKHCVTYTKQSAAVNRTHIATKTLLDKNGEFTINVPLKGTDRKAALGFCGSKSGRDVDKIKELGLTLEEPEKISVPGIKEFPITLECRVVYKQDQNLSFLDEDKSLRYYAPGTANDGDYHTAYYGEVLSAYIIED